MKTKKSLQSLEKDGRIYSKIASPSKLLPDGYFQWRKDIEQLIEISKLRSVINVNTDTLTLYRNIGNSILHKQKEEGWGKKVIEQLSKDLTKRFPYDRDYSERNLRDMKRFAREYPNFPILQVPFAKLRENTIWQVSPAELRKDDA